MAPAISDNPTMNQLLRELEIPVSQENLDKIGAAIGKKGSKTTKIPTDKVEEVKKLFSDPPATGNGSTGDKPEKAKSKKTTKKPPFNYSAFNAWTETIEWLYPDRNDPHARKPGQILKRFKEREGVHGGTIVDVRYVTADGGTRVMALDVMERRAGWAVENKYGVPYYLLSSAKEAEGIQLLKDFPGCPTMEDRCPICETQLFDAENGLTVHLRDILERILLGKIKLVPGERVRNFRTRHRPCLNFIAKVDELASARMVEIGRLGQLGNAGQMARGVKRFDTKAYAEAMSLIPKSMSAHPERMKYYHGVLADKFDKADQLKEG